jgi:hypothetical protein
LIKVKLKARAL